MSKQIVLENQNEFNCQNNHNQQIKLVVLDPNLQKNKRLICNLCLENFQSNYPTMGFQKMIQIINDLQKQKMEELENKTTLNIKQLEKCVKLTQELRMQFNRLFDSLIRIAEDWSKDLELQIKECYQYKFEDELDDYIKKQNNSQIANIKLIKNINRSWMNKLYNNLNQYNQNEDKINFRELKKQFMKIINQKESQEDEIKLNLIDQSVKQSIKCNAISFDSSGQYMISTEYQNIKVWTFKNGKIKYLQTLYGHSKWIQCLLYSKKQNSFISGAGDKTIRCWKNKNINDWISSEPYKQHTDWVMCLEMNKNEDLLFSGSSDYSIKVWKLDFNQNELTYLYSLNNHKYYVISISLNQLENQLVSCAQLKNQIIIWERKEKNTYEFKYVVKQSIYNYGLKVSFITENSFIWITGDQGKDMIYFFELIEGIYQEIQHKSIQLTNNNEDYDEYFFPIIYNKQRNLILVRHKSQIYLIRNIDNGNFKIVRQLNCNTSDIYGTITDDGQYLVFWDSKNNGYSIYEL
ncbi:unnamed protein product [Paramecium primaurelia]|uniref:WD40-repeat-containing domain n=1 Tax=Paramecium primaurelia TaxID=5886 RepID=A0A8S1N5Y7_PARPR|nr:unnamed protein product [Paramecium primaurelia]